MTNDIQTSSTQAAVQLAVETRSTGETQQTQQQPVENKPEGPSPAEVSKQSSEDIQKTVAAINDYMSQAQRTLNFSFDETGGGTIIRVIDTSNDELVRQIPSEDFIEISKHIEQMNNLLFSEKA